MLRVLLAVCALAAAEPEHLRDDRDPHGHHLPQYPGRPLKLVDISRLSQGHNEHESIEERIAKEVLGPVYVTPQNVIDYRYLRKGGRAYKQGVGGQILILPYRPTPGDYQHVFDHLLQQLRQREIAEERDNRPLGQQNEHGAIFDTNPVRIIRPDHEVSPHHDYRNNEHRPVLELRPEHEIRHHEPRPYHEPRPVLELRPEYEQRPRLEQRPHHEQRPLPRPVLERRPEQGLEYRPYQEQRREEGPRNERPRFEPARPIELRPNNEQRHYQSHKPHHVPWV